MPPVIKLTDQKELIPTKNFPYGKFYFEYFNPIQSQVFNHYTRNNNCIVASSTASGKTLIGEFYLANEIRERGGKGLYLSPLRALAQEKLDDWTSKDHHFHDLNISICTGDYKLTNKRKTELANANLILMTSEMLNSICRNYYSEKNEFLHDVKTLVVDECFPANTNIRINQTETKPIQEITDQVLSYNLEKDVFVAGKVVRKITRQNKEKLIKIHHELGTLTCTPNHKVWTISGYQRVYTLKKTDKLMFLHLPLFAIPFEHELSEIIDLEETEVVNEVYDLEVEKYHNYFANNVLVSNCHLLTVPVRGDHLEAGLMKFTEINKDCRLVCLSATMPNVEEVADWISYSLTKRETILVESDFRPCKLSIHYEKYDDEDKWYDEKELQKVILALQIVEEHPEDKFLIFAHTKRTGELMKKTLLKENVKCEFHNADLNKENRTKIETEFKTGNLQAIVATSTLSAGLNLPARRVIVLGVHRGLDEVAVQDIIQECVAPRSRILTTNDDYLFAEEVMIGDIVKGFKSGLVVDGKVTKVIRSKGKLKHFRFKNGTKVSLSNHPVILDDSWISSDKLKIGDKIRKVGGFSEIISIMEDDQISDLYNFQVKDCNTFIVEDIVTHNCGRAGRPLFDKVGDAYILLPKSEFLMHKSRLSKIPKIQSQMLETKGGCYKVLAFHLVSEIYQGNIKYRDDIKHWFERSFACFQAQQLSDDIVNETIEILKKINAIWEDEQGFSVTSIGKVASLFYFSPFDVHNLKKNFGYLFDNNKDGNDVHVAVSLGNIDSHKFGITNKTEREEMSQFAAQVKSLFTDITDSAIKTSFAYYLLLTGNQNFVFAGLCRNLQFDFPRVKQVLIALDGFTGKWERQNWFEELELRINYGVTGNLVNLCQLPHIGKVRANKLWNSGIKSWQDIITNIDRVRKTLGLKKEIIEEIVAEAKKLTGEINV